MTYNKTVIIGIVIACGIAGLFGYVVLRDFDSSGESDTQIVGDDRDEYGCIGSAGYSWCDVKEKCLRPWEESCDESMETHKDVKTNSTGTSDILPVEPDNVGIVDKTSCESNNGEWYDATNVCEINTFSQEECVANGGVFNECASACRHNPKAEMCTMQCVLTCTFE